MSVGRFGKCGCCDSFEGYRDKLVCTVKIWGGHGPLDPSMATVDAEANLPVPHDTRYLIRVARVDWSSTVFGTSYWQETTRYYHTDSLSFVREKVENSVDGV